MPPDVVVFPTSTQDVSLVAKACTEMRAPMIPFGTGTGMEGGVISGQVTDPGCSLCRTQPRGLVCKFQNGTFDK